MLFCKFEICKRTVTAAQQITYLQIKTKLFNYKAKNSLNFLCILQGGILTSHHEI